MSIMDMIKKFNEKHSIDKQKYKELETDDKLHRILEERKKSSNRRELEKYYKDKEEEKIKQTLDKIHKQQNSEMWKSKHGVLDKGVPITKTDRPILKEKNIFLDKKNNIPFTKGGMYFK